MYIGVDLSIAKICITTALRYLDIEEALDSRVSKNQISDLNIPADHRMGSTNDDHGIPKT